VIESLDAAWKGKMDMTHSSRKAWALIQRFGAAERPPRKSGTPVRANAVAAHLIQVAQAPPDKKFEHKVQISGSAF